MKNLLTFSAIGLATALTVSACGGDQSQATESQTAETGLPSSMAWSTYGTGTSTYADTAAAADALTSREDVSIRIVPSDTLIGQLTPLRDGQVGYTRTGDANIYAFEGDHNFAAPDWGPQDVRIVWTPVAPHSLMATEDSGIERVEDLEGKRVPRAINNPAIQAKTEGLLASGGLTWDDVEVVDVEYGDMASELQAGQIDVLYHQTYGSRMFELESDIDVRWLDVNDPGSEGEERLQEIVPAAYIDSFSDGPGQEEGEETNALYDVIPLITTGDTSEDEIYSVVKALDENFDAYQDTTQTTPGWGIEEIETVPTQVPFHPGLIQYLEEQDLWTEEAEARNSELVERGEALREEWPEYVEQADGDVTPEDWTAWKTENVPE